MELDKVTIMKALDQCPIEIDEAADKEIDAYHAFRDAEIERKREYQRKYLIICAKEVGKKRGEKKTIPAIEAEIEAELYDNDLDIVKKEATWKRAQKKKQYWRDKFAAAKYKIRLVTNEYGYNL